jgi:hypothetical protein
MLDEPCQGTGADQVSRWRRAHDPDNRLPRGAVRIVVSKASRDRTRRLTIAVRTPADSRRWLPPMRRPCRS